MLGLKILLSMSLLGMIAFARQVQGEEVDPGLSKQLEGSSKASLDWLKLVDQEKYQESWSTGSSIFQNTISQEKWAEFLEKIRKPLGSLISRQVLDQRTAKNPKGLPEGDYMVLLYDSSFSNLNKGVELVTLVLSEDGQWRVLTYQVNQAKKG